MRDIQECAWRWPVAILQSRNKLDSEDIAEYHSHTLKTSGSASSNSRKDVSGREWNSDKPVAHPAGPPPIIMTNRMT